MSDAIPVDPVDPARKNSKMAGPVEEESTVMLDQAQKICYWNDREFAEGQVVESGGKRYECTYGQWVQQG